MTGILWILLWTLAAAAFLAVAVLAAYTSRQRRRQEPGLHRADVERVVRDALGTAEGGQS